MFSRDQLGSINEKLLVLLTEVQVDGRSIYELSPIGQIYLTSFRIRNPKPINLVPASEKRPPSFRDDHYPIGFKDFVEKVWRENPWIVTASSLLQIIPRLNGQFNQPFKLTVTSDDEDRILVHLDNWSLEIAPSYGDALRSHTKQDDTTLSQLLAVFKGTDLFDEVKTLPKLVRVDARACLNRLRTVAEKLAYLVLAKKGIVLSQRHFASAVQVIQTNKILSTRSVGYLHTIRVIGNLASHPSGEPLADTDVRIVSYSLACVMEEIIDKYLI